MGGTGEQIELWGTPPLPTPVTALQKLMVRLGNADVRNYPLQLQPFSKMSL